MAHLAQMSSGTLPSVQELFSLAGKTAIVTGGTGGLGLAMSIALAEAGADIVSIQMPNDPRSNLLANAMEELGRKFQVFETDVADSPKLRECFAKIWEAGVIPDILLNCAGINRRSQVENFTDEDIDAVSEWERNLLLLMGILPWLANPTQGTTTQGNAIFWQNPAKQSLDQVFAINLKASFVAAQEFGKKLLELKRPGKIINIASIISFIANINIAAYACTKGGVLQMTKAFSNEWAGKGINVNCICPG
jgi:2-deoxy-D-gluconate 3-dehydrogenase